jgi:hypothetical protein
VKTKKNQLFGELRFIQDKDSIILVIALIELKLNTQMGNGQRRTRKRHLKDKLMPPTSDQQSKGGLGRSKQAPTITRSEDMVLLLCAVDTLEFHTISI